MRSFFLTLAIFLFLNLFGHNVQTYTCDSISIRLMEQTWREFRAIHPFGFQTVGLKHKGDTCIFVISEPAEWVRAEDLVTLFTKYDGHLIECIQPYGYDGELHDFVGCLRKDSINPNLFRSELFKLLYYTDDKTYYTDLDLPAKHVFFSEKKLNFNITSDVLTTMFNESFKVSSKKNLSFANLMTSKTSNNKLYFSKKRGFVVWILDSISVLQTDSVFLKTARSFALDTDIILGYIFVNGKVAIIGRERELPVNILPPLRSETIRQLLTCNDLSQVPLSIKTTNTPRNSINNLPSLIFSSLKTDSLNSPKTDSVQPNTYYYAPIEMSRMVRDTELGNLMYLTDIILKSWCENGKVKDLFIDYPHPKSFPYPNGVIHELGDSLKVYWRMYANLQGTSPIYNTGCCFPAILSFAKRDGILKEKEIEVSRFLYSYFAGQQCTDLVRLKQYSILMSAFSHLTVGQSELHGTSRQKTPSVTVSNKKWLYGGYQGIIIKGGKIAKTRQLLNPKFSTRPIPISSPGRGNTSIATTNGGPSIIAGATPKAPPTNRVTTTPDMSSPSLRKAVVHTQHNAAKRGFDQKTHNTPSKNLLLSEPEKQELLDKSYREKRMMEDLKVQLQQLNIPVKVILNEQRIIIHAINLLNNYEKEYEWAA